MIFNFIIGGTLFIGILLAVLVATWPAVPRDALQDSFIRLLASAMTQISFSGVGVSFGAHARASRQIA